MWISFRFHRHSLHRCPCKWTSSKLATSVAKTSTVSQDLLLLFRKNVLCYKKNYRKYPHQTIFKSQSYRNHFSSLFWTFYGHTMPFYDHTMTISWPYPKPMVFGLFFRVFRETAQRRSRYGTVFIPQYPFKWFGPVVQKFFPIDHLSPQLINGWSSNYLGMTANYTFNGNVRFVMGNRFERSLLHRVRSERPAGGAADRRPVGDARSRLERALHHVRIPSAHSHWLWHRNAEPDSVCRKRLVLSWRADCFLFCRSIQDKAQDYLLVEVM